ncbi:MAG: CobW family GTP-binding protein, partial [Acidimicrobiales bacterium]
MAEPEEEFEFAPWDGRRVPVTLIGGYLGSGKTTAINAMLSRTTRPTAVLVNDVGPVNIDASLVKARHGDTIELTDGCVCCSLAQGLASAFATIADRPSPPDHLVIELSGVADPRRVVAWANSPGFRLDSTIVLVDAERVTDLVEDDLIAPYVLAQIDAADLLITTKLDLIDRVRAEHVRSVIAELAPTTLVVDGDSADAIAALLDLASRQPGSAVALAPPQLFDPHVVTTIPLPHGAT